MQEGQSKNSCVWKVTNVFGEQISKLLLKSMVISNLSYFSQIWLFCSKGANNEINRTRVNGH